MLRWTLPIVAVLAGALFNLGFWAYHGREQVVPDAGTNMLESLSFSPYLRGENPLLEVGPSLGEISQDLEMLAGRTAGVRTYSSLSGMEAVPRFARPLGMTVTQGAWLGRDPDQNEGEIESLINVANNNPDVVKSVIVGNEVLLRRDLTPQQLARYIRRVKRAVKQPVTYADVWEYWLKYPQIAKDVDYITIHILPYWEDQPIAIDHAEAHILDVYHKIQATFPGKRIVIGEIGWPSAGRMREGALPSLVNEARFVREFAALARANHLDYNIVEAFDQGWKRALEGTVGGHWGLLDQDGVAKFDLSGPVSNDPDWRWHFAWAAGFGALAVLAASLRWRGLGLGAWLAFAIAAQAFGSFLVLDAGFTDLISWTAFDKITGGLGLAASLLAAGLLLNALGAALAERPWPNTPLPTAEEAINLLRGRPQLGPTLGERMLGLCQFGFMVGAAVATVALVIDPRYRDFPSQSFLVPAFGYALFALGRDRRGPAEARLREEGLLVALLLAGALVVLIEEGLRNTQAIGWCGTLVLLSVPWGLKLAALRPAAAAPALP